MGFTVLGLAVYEPLRALHLWLETRSEMYARFVERRHPGVARGFRWIRRLDPSS